LEILKEKSEHLRFHEPHCHLAPLSREPLRQFAQTLGLYFWKLESLIYILSDGMGDGSIVLRIFLVGFVKGFFSAKVRFSR